MGASMSTETAVLYQWPPGLGVDSIFPRCVVFKRICNVAQHELKIVNMKLPLLGASFEKELRERLAGIPVLLVGEKRYNTSQEILEALLESSPSKSIKSKLTRLASPLSYVTQQWANECFINTLVYARWLSDENFARFQAGVNWGDDPATVPERLAILRQEILRYLKRTPTGGLNAEQFEAQLIKQFWALENMLSTQTFLEPMAQFPTMTDFYVFMTVQGLLSPDISHASWIRDNCPSVMRWYLAVDELTRPS
jgi:hypothetical protein